MKKVLVLLVATLICALAGCGEGSFTVTGEIKSALTALPIAETVSLYVDGAARTVTGGTFVLPNLPEGPHTFSVETPGFIRYDGTINLTADRHLVIPLISAADPILDASWENNYGGTNEDAASVQIRDSYVYVSTLLNKILRYTLSGTFVDVFASAIPAPINHMKFDSSGNLWGLDTTGDVHQFNASGTLVRTYDGLATALSTTWGLAVDEAHIYVVDPSDEKVKKYRRSDGVKVAEIGEANGLAFSDPCQLAFGPDGNLYMADFSNGRIVVLSKQLSENRTFTIQLAGEYTPTPMALTFGPDGCLYVHDRNNHRIKKISPSDDVILCIPTATTTLNMWVNGLAVDSFGNLYVTDNNSATAMVHKFHWDRSALR